VSRKSQIAPSENLSTEAGISIPSRTSAEAALNAATSLSPAPLEEEGTSNSAASCIGSSNWVLSNEVALRIACLRISDPVP